MLPLLKIPVLCVDDESHILDALKRQLRRSFDVTTATSGTEALEIIQTTPHPLAVIISDMKMPNMNGAEFLKKARALQPDSARILLTGHADTETAMSAVNEGNIFRFLTKPCSQYDLAKAIDDGVKQFKLVTTEKELLEKTLHGSIKTLIDTLAMVEPQLFSQAKRLEKRMKLALSVIEVEQEWPYTLSALLGHIGYTIMPREIHDKLQKNDPLSPGEKKIFNAMPKAVDCLLANIPRIDQVREILLNRFTQYDGKFAQEENLTGEDIPIGSRILKILDDLDRLEYRGYTTHNAFDMMSRRSSIYDTKLLKQIWELFSDANIDITCGEVALKGLKEGMILASNIKTKSGVLLVQKDTEISPIMLAKLRNYDGKIKEPLRIVVDSE